MCEPYSTTKCQTRQFSKFSQELKHFNHIKLDTTGVTFDRFHLPFLPNLFNFLIFPHSSLSYSRSRLFPFVFSFDQCCEFEPVLTYIIMIDLIWHLLIGFPLLPAPIWICLLAWFTLHVYDPCMPSN